MSKSENYVSWCLNSDPIFDAEGEEVGSDEYALIEKIYVCPAERRQGKAKQMLSDAIKEIKTAHPEISIKIAALPFGDDQIDMEDLVNFYEKMGFSVTDTNGAAVIMKL